MRTKLKRKAKLVSLSCKLEQEVHDRLTALKQQRGVTYSPIVNQALKEFLFPEHRDEREAHITARLDRMSRQIQSTRVDMDGFRELFGLFLQVWFNRNPPLPKGERREASQRGRLQMEQLLDQWAEHMRPGKSIYGTAPQAIMLDEEDFEERQGKDA